MKLYPLNINNTRFDVALADTPEEQAKGLSGLPRLGKRKGMLFVFDSPLRVHMVMRDMNFDLDFIFLDDNWNVTQINSLIKEDKFGVTSLKPIAMVLEIPYGAAKSLNLNIGDQIIPEEGLVTQYEGVKKFKKGGTFEKVGEKIYNIIIDDVKPEEGKLQILNENGEVVANVEAGATIFSREHTKEIINKFKEWKSGKDVKNDFGKLIVNILDIQDKQSPDYVKKD
jgi:uncharacterized membrane protein (UPF0127 family)